MTTTRIHLTKKLEKTASKLTIQDKNKSTTEGLLGKWNATLFYVDRKKCWLISNGFTKYNVVLADVKAADLKQISVIFTSTLFTQLIYDGIFLTFEELNKLVGSVEFFATDNDRSTTAFQNQRMMDLEAYKSDYGSFEQMPFKDIVSRLNNYPIRINQKSNKNSLTNSTAEMSQLISASLK